MSSESQSADRIVHQLNKSGLLVQYLREVIIAETLGAWVRSPEYNLITRPATIESGEQPQLNPADLRAALLEQYKRAEWGHLISSHFLHSKTQLDRVLFSSIQVKDRTLAQELYCRVREPGYTFAQIAITHSEGPSAKRGGIVGPIGISQLHPVIQHYLTGLTSKQLSPLFQFDGYYVFLRLERWLSTQFSPEIEQKLLDDLFERWLQQQIASQIANFSVTTIVPTEAEVDRVLSNLSEIEGAIDISALEDPLAAESSVADRSSPTIKFSHSFFPPTGSGKHDFTNDDGGSNSSFFAPQTPPTQSIDFQKQPDQQVQMQRFIAFVCFSCLFLGSGYGAIYLFKLAEATSVPPERSSQ